MLGCYSKPLIASVMRCSGKYCKSVPSPPSTSSSTRISSAPSPLVKPSADGGGAFYYWNAPFVAPGTTQITTVGEYIRTHPAEYEKFVSCNCNAAAAWDAIWETRLPGLTPSATIPGRADAIVLARAKLLFDGMAVNSQAQAPQWAKDEIQSRVVRLATGGSAAGSPDKIVDYSYHGGTWWHASFLNAPIPGVISLVPIPAPVRDTDVIKQLNARRAIRIEHQSFTPVPGG